MSHQSTASQSLGPGVLLADRELEAQADRLLQRRLRILVGVAAIAATTFYGVRHAVGILGGTWTTDLLFDAWALVHGFCCVALWILYAALRRTAFTRLGLRGVDAFVFYIGALTCITSYVNEYRFGPETSIGLLSVYIVARAVFVPSHALTTLLVSLPIPLSILAIDISWGTAYFTSGEEMTSSADVIDSRIWKQALLGFAVAIATIASLLNSTLRAALAASRRLGHYRIEEKIGAGALGEVYRVTHALLRRPTALKVLRPEVAGADTIRRFESEVQNASRLSHPNTVRIYDYGRTPSGAFYYTMQYLPGRDLQDVVERNGPMPPGRVVHVLGQVCRALSEAHQIGLVHRDIKPGNIMLSILGGEYDVVKVLDFGLVKDLRDEEPSITGSGTVCGTPETLSPEVLQGEEPTPSCDIYAVGAVGCFALTGQQIFDAKTAAEFMGHHIHTPPVRPSERGLDVPLGLEGVLMQCLLKDPQARPGTAAELGSRLAEMGASYPWTQSQAAAWWDRYGKGR